MHPPKGTRLDVDQQVFTDHIFIPVEVALGTGMSCVSSVSRREDNSNYNDDRVALMTDSKAKLRLSVQIDQNQCRCLSDYYSFEHPEIVGTGGGRASLLFILPDNAWRRGYDSAATRILDTHL